MHRVIVGLGSNIDPDRHIALALEALALAFRVLRSTAPRRTAPVGPPGQPDYINAAVLLETEREADDLKAALRQLEARLGRVRSADRYAPRTIDLDILVYDGTVVDPDVYRRDFLRAQVAELAPELGGW